MSDRTDRVTPTETPIPRRVAALERAVRHDVGREREHDCIYPDSPVLFDYVRQSRRRAWWFSTTVALALLISLGGSAVSVYQNGASDGATQRDLTYMQRAADSDHTDLTRAKADILAIERQAAERHSALEQALIRIDARLTRIEESLSKRR